MINSKTFRQIALSFPDTIEAPHFDKLSFRANKRIFATYDEKNNRASIKLSVQEQDVFSCYDKTVIYPVPNKWGLQGWTIIELKSIKKQLLIEALRTAYEGIKK